MLLRMIVEIFFFLERGRLRKVIKVAFKVIPREKSYRTIFLNI